MAISGLNKKGMFEMISLTLKESVILFDKKYYSQIAGDAMGSPLRRTLAGISFVIMKVISWKIPKKIAKQFITKVMKWYFWLA